MKIYTKILLILFFIFLNLGWNYPLKEISKIECKFTNWDQHSNDCKMNLPIIKNANYESYKKDTTYRLVYSVLWSSTYTNGWDIGYGSHLGVDIASAKGTPVYSISDGTVEIAGWLNGRGNTVVIKHSFNGGNIYSVYAHLDKILVKKSNLVKEGDNIGNIGNSGNSWGNHLHFQIDVNQKGYHPYYYSSCKGSVESIVNNTNCIDLLTQNTIDPIYFLETNGSNLNISNLQNIDQDNKKYTEQRKIDPSEIESRQELMKIELELFLNRYNLSTKSDIIGSNLYIGENGKIILNAGAKWDKRGFNGNLPQDIQIEYDSKKLEIVPNIIKYVDKGERDIIISAKSAGNTDIKIKMGNKILGQYKLRIIDKKTVLDGQYGQLITIGNLFVGSQSLGIAYLKDINKMNIIGVPYNGDYFLKIYGNAKICKTNIENYANLSLISNVNCPKDQQFNEISFNYSGSLKGLTIFKIITFGVGDIYFEIQKNGNKIFKSNYFNVKYPIDIDKNDIYSQFIYQMLNSGNVTNTQNGYFAPDFFLNEEDGIEWIKKTFNIKSDLVGDKFKILTRLDFLKLTNKITGLKSLKTDLFFWDSNPETVYLTNLLVDYNFKFLDQYGDKYFQQGKQIKRKEAAYILKMLSK